MMDFWAGYGCGFASMLVLYGLYAGVARRRKWNWRYTPIDNHGRPLKR